MGVYIWCEDSGSGLQFWNEIFGTLHPDAIVETKTNNSRLRKAAEAIEDDGNEYYILMDSFVDNADVLREIDGLKRCISRKGNVHLVDVKSFEFALLSFQQLVQWVFAEKDNLKEKRKNLLKARELFVMQVVQNVNVEVVDELIRMFPYANEHNNEQITAELLRQITRNTGFETTKSVLGECFVINCCEWKSRQIDDECGLDKKRLAADTKKKTLVEQSVLKTAFEKVGL